MPFNLFPSQHINTSGGTELTVKKFLQKLLNVQNAEAFNYREMFRVFSALLIARDEDFLRHLKEGLKGVLTALSDQMQENNAEIVLAYILCLLPHAGIKPGDQFLIPQFSEAESRWIPLNYEVEAIELTATWGLEAYVMTDRERVFAYGLKPVVSDIINNRMDSLGQSTYFTPKDAQPILLFKGMPVPTGQGFSTQWFADWFSTPGSWLLSTGRNNLIQWLNQQNSQARVFGFGQGGSQACAMLFDEEMASRVVEVTAYHPSNLSGLRRDAAQEFGDKVRPQQNVTSGPKLTIIARQGDELSPSLAGLHWKFYKSQPDSTKWSFFNHILCHATQTDNLLCVPGYSNLTEDITDRWSLNMLAAQQIGRDLIFGLLVLPCRFVVIPVVRALLQHKNEALILALMVFAFSIFPGIAVSPLGITAAIAATLYLSYKLFKPITERLIGLTPPPVALCHQGNPQETVPFNM